MKASTASVRKSAIESDNNSDFSDDDEGVKNAHLAKIQQKRFGHTIKKDSNKFSNAFRIIAILIAIMIIPL